MSTKGFFDFHLHTSASDGSLSPNQLLTLLRSSGVTLAAITDHDTLDGLRLALQSAKSEGIELVSGIEVTINWGTLTVHVLGYGFSIPPQDDAFLQDLRRRRWERVEKIVGLFRRTGFDLDLEDLPSTSAPARIHVAEALARRGYCSCPQAAMRCWLRKGRRYYVRPYGVSLEVAVAWIRDQGGLCVLAHPLSTFPSAEAARDFLRDHRALFDGVELDGLDPPPGSGPPAGAETYPPLGLGLTAGSDFHAPGRGRLPGRTRHGLELRRELLSGIFLRTPSELVMEHA